jgi:hypothetical protein
MLSFDRPQNGVVGNQVRFVGDIRHSVVHTFRPRLTPCRPAFADQPCTVDPPLCTDKLEFENRPLECLMAPDLVQRVIIFRIQPRTNLVQGT